MTYIDNTTAGIHAERALIGSVLIDDTVLDQLDFKLEPRDFIYPYNQLVWTAIDYMYRNYKPIDIVTVTEELHKYDRLKDLGGFDYLNDLVKEIVTSTNFSYYANIIRDNAIRNRLHHAGEEIQRICLEHDFENAQDLRNKVDKIVDGVRDKSDIKVHRFDKDEYEEYLYTRKTRILTGFIEFDEWCGGLDIGWLYVMAARPGVGKTAKMLQMAYSIASKEENGPVVIFSLEMKKEELVSRIISFMTSISLARFKNSNELSLSERKKIKEAASIMESLPLHIIDKEGMGIEEIRAKSRQIKRQSEGEMGAIFIDYLGIMEMPDVNRGMTHAQKIGEITKRAKWLARELQCPVVLLTQMSREGERATKPSLMHLRDSGSIEQDADVVEILWEDPEDKDSGSVLGATVIQSLIAKGRSIGVNNFRYAFKGWIQTFKGLPPKR